MIYASAGFGAVDMSDLSKLWEQTKKAGTELVTKDLPRALQETLEKKAAGVAQPYVEAAIQKKAAAVYNKGNIALLAGIGAAAGLLVAGGGAGRKVLAMTVGGVLGGLAGLKIGLI